MSRKHLTAAFQIGGLLSLYLLQPVPAQGQVGYARANNPTANRYSPESSYSFNSAGPIVIRRTENGRYLVRFIGMGRRGSEGGHVQVSSYGNGSIICKPVGWNYQAVARRGPMRGPDTVRRPDAVRRPDTVRGPDTVRRPDTVRTRHFDVNVKCFDVSGHLTDSRFTVIAGWFRGGDGGTIPQLDRIEPTQLPKADADGEMLEAMINALYDKIEEIREQLNKLAGSR